MNTTPKVTMMEKHIQTVLLAIVTALLLFVGNTLFSLSLTMKEVETKVTTLVQQSAQFATKSEI